MIEQIQKFLARLELDRTGKCGRTAILVNDDTVIGQGPDDLLQLGEKILAKLDVLSISLTEPTVPFGDLLIKAAGAEETCLTPRDTETRTFLHDIPILRESEFGEEPAATIAARLGNRKGVLVEGLGIVTTGALTPEQAYINVSSIFHAIFVKYLLDLQHKNWLDDNDHLALATLQSDWLRDFKVPIEDLQPGIQLDNPESIYLEIARAGRMTVRLGLVDSFFGNISCRFKDTVFISQTAASLDELEGCIDPVPNDNRSTCGITASSELLAHRQVYEQTDAQTLLHGHPKFAVIMSMLCETGDCSVTDCWRGCPYVRQIGDTPVVAGEVGAGGLAEKITPVIGQPGKVIVFGHGVFALGRNGFKDALDAMIETERWCRLEYFRRLQANG